eukprot:5083085-Pleurochrysis_carterae.AAC.2
MKCTSTDGCHCQVVEACRRRWVPLQRRPRCEQEGRHACEQHGQHAGIAARHARETVCNGGRMPVTGLATLGQ